METETSWLEAEVSAHGGDDMPVHNRGVLRNMLYREHRYWGEKCERDYTPADTGMHWSDNH